MRGPIEYKDFSYRTNEDIWRILKPLRSHVYFMQQAAERVPDNEELKRSANMMSCALWSCEAEAKKLGYEPRPKKADG